MEYLHVVDEKLFCVVSCQFVSGVYCRSSMDFVCIGYKQIQNWRPVILTEYNIIIIIINYNIIHITWKS